METTLLRGKQIRIIIETEDENGKFNKIIIDDILDDEDNRIVLTEDGKHKNLDFRTK